MVVTGFFALCTLSVNLSHNKDTVSDLQWATKKKLNSHFRYCSGILAVRRDITNVSKDEKCHLQPSERN